VAARPASAAKKDAATTAGPSASRGRPSPRARAFLDQTKEVPPGLEWAKEVMARKAAPIAFRIDSQGPFSVTVVSGAGYQALMAGDRKSFNRSDGLLTADSDGPTYEGTVAMPAGSSYFIIKNRSSKPVEFHLQCFPGG
jgi:hypothetical protein